jgi:hypothetical protein
MALLFFSPGSPANDCGQQLAERSGVMVYINGSRFSTTRSIFVK